MRLVLGGCSTCRLLHLPARILKFIEALKHSVTCTVQMLSAPHSSLQVAALNAVPAVGMVGRTYVLRTRECVKSLQLVMSSSQVNQQ